MPESFETFVKLRFNVPVGEVDKIKKIVDAAVNPSTIKRVQAVPSLLGITGTPGGTGGSFMGGIGAVVSKLGIIAAIANQAVEFLGKMVGFLAQASPALRGVLYQFEKAMLIFFRPFGDFLASLLRPLAKSWLKMSIDWVKWTKLPLEEKLASIVDPMKERIKDIFSGLKFAELVENLGSIWDVIEDTARPIWYWISETFEPIWKWVSDTTKPIWDFVSNVFHSIWEWIFSPVTNSKSIWEWITTPIKSIWDFITGGGGGGGGGGGSSTPSGGGGGNVTVGPSGASWVTTGGTVTQVTPNNAGQVTSADIALAVQQGVVEAAAITTSSAWYQPIVDFGTSVANTISSGLSGIANTIGNIFSFQEGGIVPGPIGAPRIVKVHGGEEIRTPAQQMGSSRNINFGDIIIRVESMRSDMDVRRIAENIKDEVISNLRTMT